MYQEKIMRDLRERRDLDKNDNSEDAEIMKMPKAKAFEEYCKWNGLLGGWAYDLLKTIEDIYGIDLQTEDI